MRVRNYFPRALLLSMWVRSEDLSSPSEGLPSLVSSDDSDASSLPSDEAWAWDAENEGYLVAYHLSVKDLYRSQRQLRILSRPSDITDPSE